MSLWRRDDTELPQRRAELEHLMKRAAQGDTQALHILRHDRDSGGEWTKLLRKLDDQQLNSGLHAAIEQGMMAEHIRTQIAEIGQVYAALQRAHTTDERMRGLADYLRILEAKKDVAIHAELTFRFSAMQALKALDEALGQLRDELLSSAHSGDSAAFREVEQLILDTSPTSVANPDRPFYGLAITPLNRPHTWDELVVRHVRRPRHEQFLPRQLETPGDMLLLAVKAKQQRDVADAWYVLTAWLNRSVIARAEVPDDLITSLTEIIVEAGAHQPDE